jgi:hypothetical protein
MHPNDDTETLLALLSSLLTGRAPDAVVLLDALVQYNGDVAAAAQFLNSKENNPDKKQGGKRKRVVDLDNWLKPSASKISKMIDLQLNTDQTSSSTSPMAKGAAAPQSGSPEKPPLDLMSILRQPLSNQKSIPRLPPLMLAKPALVAEHTPCTLHLSVLPPDLACSLFHTMVDASHEWKRNKWWLFDRVVESPHRTSFYARKDDGIDGDASWQEAARFW